MLCSLHLCLPANVLHQVLHYKELTFTFYNYLGSAKECMQSACKVSILICKVSIFICKVSILTCKVSILIARSVYQYIVSILICKVSISIYSQYINMQGQYCTSQYINMQGQYISMHSNSTFQFWLQLTAEGKNLWHMIGWFQQRLKSKGQATPPQ